MSLIGKRPIKLKLLHQQLALVAIVMVVELVLLFGLQTLLWQTEAEAHRSEQAYALTIEVNRLVKDMTDAVLALIGFGVTHSPALEREHMTAWAGIANDLNVLTSALSEFPEDREQLETVLRVAKLVTKQMGDYRQELQALKVIPREANPLTLIRLNTEVRPGLKYLSQTVLQFNEHHKLLQLKQQDKLEHLKTGLNWLLVAGGIMQVLIALGSFTYFSRSIAQRLNTVADNAFRLASGQPLQPPVAGSDEITQLDSVFHKMARALTDATNKERAIVEGMPVGFLTLNKFGLIESANPRIVSVLKASDADSLVGKHFIDMVMPSDGKTISFAQIKDSALKHVCDIRLKTLDGGSFPAELSINEISDSKQELLICNVLDVSERYEIERMKHEFVAIVSHDLKTPLTSLQASLHLLGRGTLGSLNDRGKEIVDGMQQETQRLVRLVTDLLDIARMEAGHIDVERQPIDVASVFASAIKAITPAAEAKPVTLNVSYPAVQISADPDRLVQVLINLLSNAIKFAPRHSAINVTCEAGENMIEFKVTDKGPGIPEEAQSRIFERFQQVADQSPTQKEGTGLGLAICKLIIEAHGGNLGVQSSIGDGATFWFTIPMTAPTAG